ncbi:MAG: CDF family Co(II)/Ni(II) efflux transporter DmeF [Anaerolineae bacterium]|nr:CDF family Co(II)/Ni(II) efflux transporter DmeF [Anaerolineae bacterium]
MHKENIHSWQHAHTLGQDQKRPGEHRTMIVIVITGAMMIVEIATGVLFGSMALLADGLHMASHAVALGINAFAYVYARRHADDTRFSFGTGKVNALGGFTGAVLLALFALLMAWESIERIMAPVEIAFNQAIFVAIIGLLVNGGSVFILGIKHQHQHHDHDTQETDGHQHSHHHDHNLQSAYFHVLSYALTSILAIFALLAAKYLGLTWMDPLMGILGALLVARWSLGLLRGTSDVLLDKQGPDEVRAKVREGIERDGDSRVADLHLWSIGPNIYSVIISVVAHDPQLPDYYKASIPSGLGLEHVTVEVQQCLDQEPVGDGEQVAQA